MVEELPCVRVPRDRRGQTISSVLCLWFLAAAFPSVCLAGPLLADAARSAASDRQTEARTLAAWLDANPGAPGSGRVLDSYLDSEQDLGRAIQVALRFVASSASVPGAAPGLHRIAQLLSLAGRVQEAREAYLASYRAGGADGDLLEALLLSLEMNDPTSVSGELAEYRARGGANADRYDAILSLALGKVAGNGAGASSSAATDDVALKYLWIAYVGALATGDSQAVTSASVALASRFAGSPEAVMAAGGSSVGGTPLVAAYPSPPLSASEPAEPSASRSLSAPEQVLPAPVPPSAAPTPSAPAPAAQRSEPEPELPAPVPPSAALATAGPPTPAPSVTPSAAPTPAPTAPDPRFVGVQAGSFRVKENADYLARDLQSKGFSPSVHEQIQDGKSLYRVIVASGISPSDAAALLDRLSQAGYGGLIVSSW